jgi:hypothetical protein
MLQLVRDIDAVASRYCIAFEIGWSLILARLARVSCNNPKQTILTCVGLALCLVAGIFGVEEKYLIQEIWTGEFALTTCTAICIHSGS